MNKLTNESKALRKNNMDLTKAKKKIGALVKYKKPTCIGQQYIWVITDYAYNYKGELCHWGKCLHKMFKGTNVSIINPKDIYYI